MNKLLREVPTMESVITDSNNVNSFVQVTLDQDFIAKQKKILSAYIEKWLEEPKTFARSISKKT